MGNGVILDTNCFSHVFNRNDKRNSEFEPFLKWLCYGPGYLVYGGSKYLEELKKATRYTRLFQLLHNYNKADLYCSHSVDEEMERIIRFVDNPAFDDPHLAAIVVVSKCRVICTGDVRCVPFLKRKAIYAGKALCPKFYTSFKCADLLKPQYVGKGRQLTKEERNDLVESIS